VGGVGGSAERAGEGGDGLWGSRGVVGQGVGQDDGVRRGVGEVEGAATADGDAAVGAELGGQCAGAVGDLDRDVHAASGSTPGGAGAERLGDQLPGGFLLGGAVHEHAGEAERGDLVGHPAQRADPERHPHRQRLVGE
jgi:hypothetical protein